MRRDERGRRDKIGKREEERSLLERGGRRSKERGKKHTGI
jgi:hypothetical protein